MKSRVLRFRGKKAVGNVLQRGGKVSAGHVRLYVIRNERGSHRLAVICGKRVAKKAVERNRLRRVVREAILNILSEFYRPTDCVAVIQPGIRNNIRMQEIRSQLSASLRNMEEHL